MLQILGIALVALVAVILVVAALKPPRFRVQRSTVVAAAPAQVYAQLADFRNWRAWSPWEELDPALKRTYGGAETGKGAIYEWDGDKKAGAGRMEILDAPAPSRVSIQLEFSRPFAASNISEFELTGRGSGTEVVWTMHGAQPFAMRVMSLFMSMDKLIGKDFEKGLARLKSVAEGARAGV